MKDVSTSVNGCSAISAFAILHHHHSSQSAAVNDDCRVQSKQLQRANNSSGIHNFEQVHGMFTLGVTSSKLIQLESHTKQPM